MLIAIARWAHLAATLLIPQHAALQDEVRRRRDECIQLKAVLQQQNQALRSFDPKSMHLRGSNVHELLEAFQSQKLVNRQLEYELKGITEEHNSKLLEMTQEIELLRNEQDELQTVAKLNNKLESQNPQGLIKFHSIDLDKMLQRLLSTMTPRTVVGLLPGCPAYLIFKCVRYTDLTNADDNVRELLSLLSH
ncbi:unconventional myosin-Va-like [Drosophila obscura]|uniref:unconventional myosin-Va-like n=1 Tax=Drosophila obscura TaxID=7282 RepID=UPI001BB2560B|nr:unconventional myosin-Va-like [Drosophila obscura]